MNKKEEEIIKTLLRDVFRNDKTIYTYSNTESGKNRNGALPRQGRWCTPAELVQDAAQRLFEDRNIVFRE